MKIFIKYVLKCMTEKKGRLCLLIIAIAMSTGLVVASTGMIDIILNGFIKPNIACYEERNIAISSSRKDIDFFECDSINTKGLEDDSIIKEIMFSGSSIKNPDTDDETSLDITIHARPIELINKDDITQGNINQFKDQTCIISERTAKEHKLAIGDTLSVIIAGQNYDMKIIALASPDGVFYNDQDKSFTLYYPYETLAKEFHVEGKYNFVCAKANSKNLKNAINEFNKANEDLQADKLVNLKDIKEQLSSITTLLYGMLAIVVIMSSIIIYSTFKLIITERLSNIGTFLSQGATTQKIKFILRMESFFYGVIGSVLGIGLGVLILSVINYYINPLKKYGIHQKLQTEPYYFIVGVVFAIILSLLSSYLPVRKISKLQVKEVILNDVRVSTSIGYKKFIIGLVLLLGSILIYFVTGRKAEFAPYLLLASIIGTLLAYPKMIDLLSTPLSSLFKGSCKSLFFVINNLRTSKILLGNITLIIISLFSIIVIRSSASSMIDMVVDAYENLNSDIEITGLSTIKQDGVESVSDRITEDLIKLGVKKEDMNYMNTFFINLYTDKAQKKSTQGFLQCVDIDNYSNYNGYLDLKQKKYEKDIEKFKKDKNGIILSKACIKRTNKKVGDQVTIECNGLKATFTIAAVIDGKLYNTGMVNYISRETMQEVFHIDSADQITFCTDQDIDSLVKKLKPIVRSYGASFITKTQMCEENLEQNAMVVDVISIFSYLAIVIAALGIINNVSISFIQRKTEFAVLSSVGMENSLRRKILLLESFASVTWGMIIATAYCLFGLPLINKTMLLADLPFNITLSLGVLGVVYVVSLIIVLIATLPVVFKSKKLSIINELKYE